MLQAARTKNPGGRLTTPEDVARIILLLCDEKADWVSGNVIGVDGGEYIVNYIGEKTNVPIK
jgi:NAD(P)-dependent dehydrogenase (short-subunit alcohol dehydrogenase family)